MRPKRRTATCTSSTDVSERVLGAELAGKVFWDNAVALYRV